MPSYSIGQAARLLRVSPETVRRWADGGRLPMGRDGLGNRVIDGFGLARFARERAVDDERGAVAGGPPTSARNAFTGIVTALTVDEVVAQVEIQAGPHRVVSLVTREAVEELDLAVGVTVTARVKSTSVHVDRS
ncbi:helix-turn-helix domain-containing protein [Streptomyces sp. S1A1-8]|uniref:TOBE domain-containing protein n=1 Tax=unclassified Streptomyces TaxID=2593676 RepID=UPI001162E1EB|nr:MULTISPECIES: TOBE domain-containing protein [unclassified Streptomyces]QDO03171.1 helix-turn-helix domain-containing protein [Streptomyces sp. RLB1-9]QDO24903.1 helix-turn-helix domain-containing protein [Streptomyces sp. S1A1-8]QDO35024.1 helix-turn-helix domain-containing protein [Streptomyces sp. S1A1-3]